MSNSAKQKKLNKSSHSYKFSSLFSIKSERIISSKKKKKKTHTHKLILWVTTTLIQIIVQGFKHVSTGCCGLSASGRSHLQSISAVQTWRARGLAEREKQASYIRTHSEVGAYGVRVPFMHCRRCCLSLVTGKGERKIAQSSWYS